MRATAAQIVHEAVERGAMKSINVNGAFWHRIDRDDGHGFLLCPHGCIHPVTRWTTNGPTDRLHECDGCCHLPDADTTIEILR